MCVFFMDSSELIDPVNFYSVRPGLWVSPDNLLFLYRVMAELCSINKPAANTTNLEESYSLIPSFEVNI